MNWWIEMESNVKFKIQEFNLYFSPFYHLFYYHLFIIYYYVCCVLYTKIQLRVPFLYVYLKIKISVTSVVSNCFKIPFGKVFQGYIISSNKASSYMQFVMCFCLFSTFFYLATLKNKTQCSFTSFGCCNASISANFALSSHIICVVPPIKNVISIRCASILIFLDKYFFK